MLPSQLDNFYDDLEDEQPPDGDCDVVSIDPAPERREHGDAIRLDLIESVKKRLKAGFYHSERVIEDLSETFAQAINQTT